jgi:hypothetical protein
LPRVRDPRVKGWPSWSVRVTSGFGSGAKGTAPRPAASGGGAGPPAVAGSARGASGQEDDGQERNGRPHHPPGSGLHPMTSVSASDKRFSAMLLQTDWSVFP